MTEVAMSDTIRRTGSCLCRGVQFSVARPRLRIGLCHCQGLPQDRRLDLFAFAIWPREAFEKTGLVSSYGTRSFCSTCGGRVAWVDDNEAEVMIGSLDVAPTDLRTRI